MKIVSIFLASLLILSCGNARADKTVAQAAKGEPQKYAVICDLSCRGITDSDGLAALGERLAKRACRTKKRMTKPVVTKLTLAGNRKFNEIAGDDLAPWTFLEKLILSSCSLSSVPVALDASFSELKELDLSRNQIIALPDSLVGCTKLERLNLFSNKCVLFPATLCYLPNLKFLNVANNGIAKLPDEVSEMKALEILVLCNGARQGSSNTITTLPKSFKQLGKTLKALYIGCLDLDDESLAILREMAQENPAFEFTREILTVETDWSRLLRRQTLQSTGYAADGGNCAC